jgi:hypothetical protein
MNRRHLQGLAGAALALALASVLVAPPAGAAETYRYLNDKGVPVLDHAVPPEYVHKGYDVIGPDGRLVRRVPPQSEIDAQAAAARREAAASGAESQRSASDQDLLSRYRSVDELERARDRKLAQLERAVSVEQANLQRLRSQKRSYEVHGADLERGGQPVPQKLLDDLASVDVQIRDREVLVARRNAEKEAAVRDFAATIARFRSLRGG